ncbi:arsenate reductase family protein [Alicyclobacillus dauci]|uniref:Spx/MgsR family RNA polymerase-binding regulatory protein n=1 Tax=Alicyclobacillus dauci TaxID=1475485 RepID=A0ABY6YYN7_9BACL|nr:Spx/MgsR family RNA polymerase-binding regulatory protein [Alicyclobacillus dauci]WAH35745.1 Spx/MgsR family RNA polymerase-binding regulatory protein [Alicyclobacillus dauci]
MKLYGYRRCSTCRQALKTLQENGGEVEFHDMVENPPSEATIREWVEKSHRPVFDFVNVKGTVYRERDLKSAKFTDDEWIRELSQDGKLIKRPILVTGDDVFVGYHEGAYRRITLGEEESRA